MNLVKTESLIEEDALGCFMRQEALLYEDLHQKDDSSYVEAFDTILLKIMAVTPYPGLKQVIQELYDTRNTAYQRIFRRCFTSCSDVIDRALQDKIRKLEIERTQYSSQCLKLEDNLKEYRRQIGNERKKVVEQQRKRAQEVQKVEKQAKIYKKQLSECGNLLNKNKYIIF